MVERGAYHRFAHRVSLPLHVRGFAQQKVDAFPSDLGNAGKVYLVARDGRQVYLEVAAVEDASLRRVDAQRHRARDRMVHIDEFHAETAEFDLILGLDATHIHLVEAVFAQFVVRERERQFGSEHGRADLF